MYKTLVGEQTWGAWEGRGHCLYCACRPPGPPSLRKIYPLISEACISWHVFSSVSNSNKTKPPEKCRILQNKARNSGFWGAISIFHLTSQGCCDKEPLRIGYLRVQGGDVRIQRRRNPNEIDLKLFNSKRSSLCQTKRNNAECGVRIKRFYNHMICSN